MTSEKRHVVGFQKEKSQPETPQVGLGDPNPYKNNMNIDKY